MTTPNPGEASGPVPRPRLSGPGCLSAVLLAGCALALFCLLVLPVLLAIT